MDIYGFIILGMIVGYLLGSIPYGVLISKIFYKIDIRNFGSKNSGATNVTRTLGWLPGVMTMILDLIKGGLPAMIMYLIARSVISSSNEFVSQLPYVSIVYCVTGLSAAIGHCIPCFADFKGGKAVSTIFGFLIFMNVRLAIGLLVVFLLGAFISKRVSVGSISAAITLIILSFIPFFQYSYMFSNNELSNSLSLFIFILVNVFSALICIYRHYPNIKRLISGQEKKFKIEKIFNSLDKKN